MFYKVNSSQILSFRCFYQKECYVSSNLKHEAISGNIFSIPLLIVIDLLAVTLSFLFALNARSILSIYFPTIIEDTLLPDTISNLWWIPCLLVIVFLYEKLYSKRLTLWVEVEYILRALSLTFIIVFAFIYLTSLSTAISRSLLLLFWLFLIFLLPLMRLLGKSLMVKHKIWTRPVLIIGSTSLVKVLLKALDREKTIGYDVVAILVDDWNSQEPLLESKYEELATGLSNVDEIDSLLKSYNIRDVIIASSNYKSEKLVNFTNKIQLIIDNVIIMPDLHGLSLNGIEAQYFFEEQAVVLNIKNKLNSSLNQFVKRIMDIIFGSILLIMSLPLILTVALAIKINSRGSVIYTQTRLGRNGERFRCYKFRTMFINAESILLCHLQTNDVAKKEWNKYQKLKDCDPRLTKVGKFLRRYSLDELPQIINVINGEMSLIGPRPYLPREKPQMGQKAHTIQIARPGLTGLWQVSGRNEIDFEGRLGLDQWYVRNWSLWLDAMLVLRTFGAVLKREGAF